MHHPLLVNSRRARAILKCYKTVNSDFPTVFEFGVSPTMQRPTS